MILIKCQYVTKQFSANVYLIDRFSAHLQKSNKPQANHDWFFIHYDKLVDYKGFGFKAQFPNQVKFSKNSAHDFIHYFDHVQVQMIYNSEEKFENVLYLMS